MTQANGKHSQFRSERERKADGIKKKKTHTLEENQG